MHKKLFAFLVGAALLIVTGAASAQQWMPGDDHKMHFPQYPNEYGWNVYNNTDVIHLADDWECIEPGTVNDIHFWGSWQNGDAGIINGFTITIYDDIPANQSPTDYSMPGTVLWGPVYISSAYFEQYHIVPDPEAWEGWYDPLTGATPWPDHNNFYQYDINNIAGIPGIQDPFVQTEGAIYWLEISADVEDDGTSKSWGWKSSYRHFNDDAVRDGPVGGFPWLELLEPDLGPTYNSFHVEVNTVGDVVEGGGEFAWNDTWYFYDDDGEWWNIWFYDHPLNYDRWKEVHVTGSVIAADPGIPGDIVIAVNWSTPAWSWIGNPPGEPRRPPMNSDLDPLFPGLFLERFIIYQGPVTGVPVDIGNLGYNINDYNPEWVSIDVRGTNFIFDGGISHQCIGDGPVSMDLAFVVGGDPLPDPDGACCWPDGNCTIETQVDCEAVGGIEGTYMGDRTVCSGDSDGNGVDDLCEGTSPMGACCASDGGCYRTYQAACESAGGTYKGHGSACVGDQNGNGFDETCDAPPGACCLPGGSCVSLDEGSCLAQSGDYQGDGSTCLGDGNSNGIDDACEEADELKWFQPPDLDVDGMDVSCFYSTIYQPMVLATDFECTSTGPITRIHVFGSWYLDKLPFDDPTNVSFNLSLHADIPDPDGSGPLYSMPGERFCFMEDVPFTVHVYASDLQEGWFEPPNNYTMFPLGDRVCWEYTFDLDGSCIQNGTPSAPIIYWLDVQAFPDDPDAFFGWKTTREEWNDWAVWAVGEDAPGWSPNWNELRLPETGQEYMPGDIDDDGDVDLQDALYLADYMTQQGPPPVYYIPGTNPPFYATADTDGNCIPAQLTDLQRIGAWLQMSIPMDPCSYYPPGMVPGRAMDLAFALYGPSASMDQGSCCYENGSCTDDMTEEDCNGDGGYWAGVGTTCVGDSDGNGVDDACEATIPMGACCYGDPAAPNCMNTTQYHCEEASGGPLNGTWYAGQDCDDAAFDCLEAGACCFEDGTCSVGLTQTDCNNGGGSWAGVGSTCVGDDNDNGVDDVCEAILPMGACCYGDPVAPNCMNTTQYHCEEASGGPLNGTWFAGQDCDDATFDCLEAGACCFEDGTCSVGLTQTDCNNGDGSWAGVGSTCVGDDNDNGVDDVCEVILPMGACCYGDPVAPSCITTTQYLCEEASGGPLNGTWFAGQDCDDAAFECPVGGACCYDDGRCADGLTQADCEASGGSYGGDDGSCAGADSDENGVDDHCDAIVPKGACCYGPPATTWQCISTTQTVCDQTFNGTWYAGQDCATTACDVDTCDGQMPGDYNNDGLIDPADLLELIDYVYGLPAGPEANPKANGDFNGDCRVNHVDVQDMTAYLYFGGPGPADCTCLDPYGPCCLGIVGNANLDAAEMVSIGDISVMIDAKFITGRCDEILYCLTESDINLSGRGAPTCADITIGDISTLIDHLFITGPSLRLPECL